jgi:predicted Rdx family selenoprotein
MLSAYQHVIGELRIIGGGGGVFDVTVDGEKIFSKYACADRFPEPGELLETLTSMVAPGTRRYGT